MLLALWSAYAFEEEPTPPVVDTTPRGGALGWYHPAFKIAEEKPKEQPVIEIVPATKKLKQQSIQPVFAPVAQPISTDFIPDLVSKYEAKAQEFIRIRQMREEEVIMLLLH